MSDSSDRVIPATPRRREAARREGMMPGAALPAWAASAGVAILLLPAWARATAAPGPEHAAEVAWPLPAALVLPTLGVVAASAAAGLAVRFLLDGFSWQPARALPDLRRIDPLAGLRRITSAGTFAAALGNGISLAILATATMFAVAPLVVGAGAADPLTESGAWIGAAWRGAAGLVAVAAVLSACQWALARLRFERRLRMTPQEFADEAKSMQADPKVRLMQQQRRAAAPPRKHAAA
jgi:flagellar biosynthetic protein FlhB